MMRRGFDYRRAVQIVRPDLLAQLPPRLPQAGEQAHLWDEDTEQQRNALKRAKRLRSARRRRAP